MVRHSRKRNKKGGDKIDDIQVRVDTIQKELNELRNGSITAPGSEEIFSESLSSTSPGFETVAETVSEPYAEISPSEPEASEPLVNKTWVDDKNKKFNSGDGGRVTLSFNRIMSLLDNNIKKGDTKKDWTTIKSRLINANSVDDVQSVVNEYKLSFSSNYVAGTRRKRRHVNKTRRTRSKTHKRHRK